MDSLLFVLLPQTPKGHLALALRGGKLTIAFVISFHEETSISVGQNLTNGDWHRLEVNVTSGQVTARVDSSQIVLQAPSSQSISNLEKTLYLGSLRGQFFELSSILGQSATFSGCVRRVFTNGKDTTFENAQKVSSFPLPKTGCRKEDNCRPNPCKNGGKCEATWTGSKCSCLADFGGKTCRNGTFT